jgi:hypothetical protein
MKGCGMTFWSKMKSWFTQLADAVEYDPIIEHERRISALEERQACLMRTEQDTPRDTS